MDNLHSIFHSLIAGYGGPEQLAKDILIEAGSSYKANIITPAKTRSQTDYEKQKERYFKKILELA
jgi:hypothetical protein